MLFLADTGLVEVAGWGRTPRSLAQVREVASPDEIRFDASPRGHLVRGLGRSYGDAALNAGGVLWRLPQDQPIEITGTEVTVPAGVVLADLLDQILPHGLFFPVTPGTKFVTIGGAVAADVHGKNHHREGSLGHHITRLRLMTASGAIEELAPGEPLFEATLGGMGMTGAILDVTFRMKQISAPAVVVDTTRTDNLEETFSDMEANDHRYCYSVAWIDLLATKGSRGRAVITRGDHPDRGIDNADWNGSATLVSVPDLVPGIALNPLTMRVFNEAWFRKAPRHRTGELQSINRFFYPLDAIGDWNRMYGKSGFLQYQIALPSDSTGALKTVIDRLGERAAGSFLVVLKRFGPGRSLLSFPIEGWTLAVDISARLPGLAELLDEMDRIVVGAGGRTYFAKDARTKADLIGEMYPDLDEWRAIANKNDPDWTFRSDLERRLRLRGPR